MLNTYRTVADFGQDEIIIEKSTFIGYAKPVTSEEEAQAFIQEIKKKHRDATHNVPAYVIGENNDIQRCNDDGEPSGTAGKPILGQINSNELTDILIILVRYFGGIKKLIWQEGSWNIGISFITSTVNCLLFLFIANQVRIGGITEIGNYSLYTGALNSISGGVSTLINTVRKNFLNELEKIKLIN